MIMSFYVFYTCFMVFFFFFKQKTAFEMRISDWSSDVCSSDLVQIGQIGYNPSSLFNAQDILKFAKLLDINANVDSIWMPESWGREAFVKIGRASCRERVCQYV